MKIKKPCFFFVLKYLSLIFIFLQTASFSNDEIELAKDEKTYTNSLGTKEYFHTIRILNNPYKILEFKQRHKITFLHAEFSMTAPESYNEILKNNVHNKNTIDSFGMGQYKFSENEKGYLYTHGIRDCIALIAFDEKTKKLLLYHVSKMELRKNDFGDFLFEKAFMPKFQEFFKKTTPKITLISSCYNKDLAVLIDFIQKSNFQISQINIPNILLEDWKEKDSFGDITKSGMNEYIDTKTVFIEPKKLLFGPPTTSVMVNKKDGSIQIYRD